MLLRRHVTSLGTKITAAQRNDLLDRRRKLEARISAYGTRMTDIMKLDDDVKWSTLTKDNRDSDPDSEESLADQWELHSEDWFTPEWERIVLPSAMAHGEVQRLSLQSLAAVEAQLRKAQVNDALEGLRLALGEKSLCFRTEVRNSSSQKTSLRAWENVHKRDNEARKCREAYRLARSALERLQMDTEYLNTLEDITDEQLKVSGDLTDERRFGQRSDALPWFWRFGGLMESGGPRMEECT